MISTSRLRSERGNIAVYVAVMIVGTVMLLAAMFQVSLSAFTSSIAWDIRRQREVEARAVASAAKEAILAVAETAPVSASRPLGEELSVRASGVTNGAAGISILSSSANDAVVLPANPQWPASIPAPATAPDFNVITGVGRAFQALLSAGPVADLGIRTFVFTQANAVLPTETPTYRVDARLFSVPVSNFTWIAYGRPTTPGGVASSPPTPPVSSRSTGFTSPLVHSYSGESGSFPDMFGGIGTALPYYYRDLVSLTWNAFEYWTSLSYQNTLLTSAGPLGVFDFTNPASLPSGVTWDGTKADLDLAATTADLVVFVDSVGGNTLRINGSGSTGAPVVVAIRNFSATPTIIEVANNNSRTVLLYAPNSTINPLSAGLSIRGGILLFGNSHVSASLDVNGFVAYPQSFVSPPLLTAYPDTQAQQDMVDRAPRALLVSTRGIVQ